MAGFQESGLNLGQVLPAPQTAAVTNGMHFGANGLWQYPPGYLLAADLGGTGISNSASETSLLTGAITGMFPAGVAIGDTVHVRAAGKWINNSTANQTLTLNLYLASTQIVSVVTANAATSATQRAWQLDIEVPYTIIAGAGSGAVRPFGQLVVSATGTGFQSVNATNMFIFNDAATTTVATNATATGDLKGQVSQATTGSTSVVCNYFRARYFPKSY